MNPKSILLTWLLIVGSCLTTLAGDVFVIRITTSATQCSGDHFFCSVKVVEPDNSTQNTNANKYFYQTGTFKIILPAGLEFDQSLQPTFSKPPVTDVNSISGDFIDNQTFYVQVSISLSRPNNYKDSVSISNLKIKIKPTAKETQTISVNCVPYNGNPALFPTPENNTANTTVNQPSLKFELDATTSNHYCENRLITFKVSDKNNSSCKNYTIELRGKTGNGADYVVLGTSGHAPNSSTDSTTSVSTSKINRNINSVYVVAKYGDNQYGIRSDSLSVGDESSVIKLNEPQVFPFLKDSIEVSYNAANPYINEWMNIADNWQTVLAPEHKSVYSNFIINDFRTETRYRWVQKCETRYYWIIVWLFPVPVSYNYCWNELEPYYVRLPNPVLEQSLRQDGIYQFTFSGAGIHRNPYQTVENCTFHNYSANLSNCGPDDFNSIYFDQQATEVAVDKDNYLYAVTKQFYTNINDYCTASDSLKIKIVSETIFIAEPICANDTATDNSANKRIRVNVSTENDPLIPPNSFFKKFVVVNGNDTVELTPIPPSDNKTKYFNLDLRNKIFQPNKGKFKALELISIFYCPMFDAGGSSYDIDIRQYSKQIRIYTPVTDADFINLGHAICPSIDSVRLISNYKIENVTGFGTTSANYGNDWYFNPSVAYKHRDSIDNAFLTLSYYDSHCHSSVVDTINIKRAYGVDSTGVLLNLPTAYCHNEKEESLSPSHTVDSIYTTDLSLNKVLTDKSVYNNAEKNTWYFNPSKVVYPQSKLGDSVFNLVYNYFDKKGCPWSKAYPIIIYDTIRSSLAYYDICNNDTTKFLNTSKAYGAGKDSTITWDFGDFTPEVKSNFAKHFYKESGKYPLKMTVYSTKGCTSILDSAVIYGDKTEIDFGVTNHVVNAGNGYDITFHNLTREAGFNPVAKYVWDFDDGLTPASPPIYLTDFVYGYAKAKLYHVNLNTIMSNGCTENKTIPIPIFPYVNVTDQTPHMYDFQDGEQGWISSKDFNRGQNGNWQYGAIGSAMSDSIHSPSNYAWSVGKSDSLPQVSWIESPCFNIDSLAYPMLTMDMFESIESGLDGAVVQYTVNDGISWNTLGDLNPDIAWYDLNNILSKPAALRDTAQVRDASFGWSKNINRWQNVRYPLEQVIDSIKTNHHPFPCVRFRVKYTSNGTNPVVNNFKGFAFDNFDITWRRRVLLVEQFTNTSYDADSEQEEFKWLNNYLDVYRDGAVAINYHPWIDNKTDLLYDINRSDISARASEYGILFRPKTILDGFYESEPPSDSTIKHYSSMLTLQDPGFDIHGVDMKLVMDSLVISAGVLKLKKQLSPINKTIDGAHYNQDCVVRMAIVQKDMSLNNINYKNVLIELLPNGEGNTVATIPESVPVGGDTRVAGAWAPQITTVGGKFRLIIFVQGMTGLARVQQVWYKDIPDALVPKVTITPSAKSENTKSANAKVYPTPANDLLYVQFDEKMPVRTKWQIINMAGMTTLDGQLEEDCRLFSINVSHLADGVYLLTTTDAVTGVAKMYKILIQKNR